MLMITNADFCMCEIYVLIGSDVFRTLSGLALFQRFQGVVSSPSVITGSIYIQCRGRKIAAQGVGFSTLRENSCCEGNTRCSLGSLSWSVAA